MINFFRHIRQKLLSENRLGKYAIYACGEIILVVIGILIALQINGWYSDSADLKKEQLILKSLRNNLAYSLDDLNKEYKITRSHYEDTLRLADMVGPNAIIDEAEIDHLLASILNPSSFDPTTGVMDEIIYSGHLDLINDRDLKDRITNWSRVYEDAEEDIALVFDFIFNTLAPYLNDKANYLNIPAPGYLTENNKLPHPKGSSFKNDYKIFMTSLEFENLLSMHLLNTTYVLYEYEAYRNYFETTIGLLDAEIGNK